MLKKRCYPFRTLYLIMIIIAVLFPYALYFRRSSIKKQARFASEFPSISTVWIETKIDFEYNAFF